MPPPMPGDWLFVITHALITTCSDPTLMPAPSAETPLLIVSPLKVTLMGFPAARATVKMRKFGAAASRRTVRLLVPGPLTAVSSPMFGKAVSREIVPLTPVASITSAPRVEFAEVMAARRLPAPLSSKLLTTNVAGTVRSSMPSRRSCLVRSAARGTIRVRSAGQPAAKVELRHGELLGDLE